MPQKERPPLSEAERAVLKCLWESGPGTVRAIHDLLASQGQDWKRSTVITLLQRLERKGYVASDRSKFAFVFRPIVSLEEVLCQRMTELAQEFSDGDAVPVVLAFAARQHFTDQEIRRFRQMIDQMESQRSAPRRKPSK